MTAEVEDQKEVRGVLETAAELVQMGVERDEEGLRASVVGKLSG